MILATGISNAEAQQLPTRVGRCSGDACMVTAKAVQECKDNVGAADVLAKLEPECVRVKREKDEIAALLNVRTGERDESRLQASRTGDRLLVVSGELVKEKAAPSRWVVFGAGAASGVVAVIVVRLLVGGF